MKADPPEERSDKEWTDLFSDPEAALAELRRGERPRPSPALLLALWLEYFLQKGGEGVRERLSLLAEEELTELAVSWLTCYLSRPLYVRIHRSPETASHKGPLHFSFIGRLVKVEQGSGGSRRREILYPLDHKRLWPEALRLLPERVFSSPEVIRALTPAIALANASRLEKIRGRGQTLASLLGKTKDEAGRVSEMVLAPEKTIKEAGLAVEAKDLEPAAEKTAQGGGKPSKRKKKRKSLEEQLELFS